MEISADYLWMEHIYCQGQYFMSLHFAVKFYVNIQLAIESLPCAQPYPSTSASKDLEALSLVGNEVLSQLLSSVIML